MEFKHKKPARIVTITSIAALICGILIAPIAYCSGSLTISADIYNLGKDSHYVIDGTPPSGGTAIGTLSLSGDVRKAGNKYSFPSYDISDGNATFSYRLNTGVLNRSEYEWHMIEDKSKKVNGLILDSNILSGALIVQTSLDGVIWVEDVLMSDIFAADTNIDGFYTTKDVQLQNGCYYRVFVAYKMEIRTEDSKIAFVTTKNYEYKQVAEVYEFYAFCETSDTSPDATPSKRLGSKINTGKDNGYSGNEPIDKDDPHYGWDIGYFFINGYTRETVATDQTPVFLKNVGDRVTLWFHLSEDINCLQGDEHLTISEDINGYDRAFEIEQTNFERGTLIIQYTNAQGEAQAPIIYTDYLAANTRTGANTKVQLFEEGDYVVSLNYEIKSIGGPLNTVASYTNYKITFSFLIRNGNCMVYPFDSLTGSELSDNAITENGFKLDMAKSKYLTIDVQKSVLNVGPDGLLTEDIRFNRPAKDGESYTSEGIYRFTVSNLYTDQTTTKTIYVGTNSYLRALSASGMTVEELNEEIAKGSIIHEDGTIEAYVPPVEPPPVESPPEEPPEELSEDTEAKAPCEGAAPAVNETLTQTPTGALQEGSAQPDDSPEDEEDITLALNVTPYAVSSLVVVFAASALWFASQKKKKTKTFVEKITHVEEDAGT